MSKAYMTKAQAKAEFPDHSHAFFMMEVLKTSTKKGRAQSVLTALLLHSNFYAPFCQLSVSQLADKAGTDVRYARRMLLELKEAGTIEIVSGAGGGRHVFPTYRIHSFDVDNPDCHKQPDSEPEKAKSMTQSEKESYAQKLMKQNGFRDKRSA